MTRSFKSITTAAMLLVTTLVFTSCEGTLDDIFGEWSRPATNVNTPTPSVTEITVDLSVIADEYLNADKTQLKLIEGSELTLKFIIQPAELADTEVTLSSEDGEIVSIDGLMVKALKPGTTKVTAKAGEKTCVVTVVVESALTIPLTLEVLTAGTIVINDYKVGLQYSLDGGVTKNTITTNHTEIIVAVGDKVQFYGHGTDIQTYRYGSSKTGTYISGGTAECKVYGNIMSLVDEFGFAENTTLSNAYNFGGLFTGNDKLNDARYLKLPATTLTTGCYNQMFNDCTELTTAPELPAGGKSGGSLATECYHEMFKGCTSLSTAPALPALNLNEKCYQGMFRDCSKLATAPELPAGGTSGGALADYCYQEMFALCSNLTAAPALPALTLKKSCYESMFYSCSKLEETPHLASTNLAENCYYKMFEDCTGLKKAYVKAAYTLANFECYDMFSGCTNLDDGRKFYSSYAATYKTEFDLSYWLAEDYE